jgi:hypothetical protein
MNDDDIPDIPPEELDMVVEEALGHPPAGPPAERIEALQKRVAYLKQQLAAIEDLPDADAVQYLNGIVRDLKDARRQLAEQEHQLGARN